MTKCRAGFATACRSTLITYIDNDSLPEATKALVFMAVCEFACTYLNLLLMCKLGAIAEHAINKCET